MLFDFLVIRYFHLKPFLRKLSNPPAVFITCYLDLSTTAQIIFQNPGKRKRLMEDRHLHVFQALSTESLKGMTSP